MPNTSWRLAISSEWVGAGGLPMGPARRSTKPARVPRCTGASFRLRTREAIRPISCVPHPGQDGEKPTEIAGPQCIPTGSTPLKVSRVPQPRAGLRVAPVFNSVRLRPCVSPASAEH